MAHAWLYPCAKNQDGSPKFREVDGEKHYDIIDPNGIEIFSSRDGPATEMPQHAEFPINKTTKLPFLDVSLDARAHTHPNHPSIPIVCTGRSMSAMPL